LNGLYSYFALSWVKFKFSFRTSTSEYLVFSYLLLMKWEWQFPKESFGTKWSFKESFKFSLKNTQKSFFLFHFKILSLLWRSSFHGTLFHFPFLDSSSQKFIWKKINLIISQLWCISKQLLENETWDILVKKFSSLKAQSKYYLNWYCYELNWGNGMSRNLRRIYSFYD
jgi:hypothetical protein